MISTKALGIAAGLALICMVGQANAASDVATPDAAYLASTTKLLPPGSAVDGDAISSLSDSLITVDFGSSTLLTAGVTWLSWGSPPDAEQDYFIDTVPVFYTGDGVNSVTFSFSRLVSAFGVELGAHGADFPEDSSEPYDAFGDGFASFTASFYRGGLLQFQVARDVYPLFDSKLFAAKGGAFDQVVISGNDEFAFAQMRYAVVPEPTSWALMIMGVGAVGAAMRSRRRIAAA